MSAFTWSYPAARAFEVCRRKRYWRYYADSPERERAHVLGRLMNREQLAERAVVAAGLWLRAQNASSAAPTSQEAYEQAARPLLNDVWKSVRSAQWKQPDAKAARGLLEEAYPKLHPDVDADWPKALKTEILNRIEQLHTQLQPLFARIPREADIALGETQRFEIDQVAIRIDPHWAYREDDGVRIHRWECGMPDPMDQYHMGLLVKWATVALDVAPEQVRVIFDYVALGQSATEEDSVALLEAAEGWMQESWMDMSDYLENADRHENQPRPKLEWDMTPDRDVCRDCCYYALCKPEF